MNAKSPITTHVLDTSLGRPAANVAVQLEAQDASGWRKLGQGATNSDGRLFDLLPPGQLKPGSYRLTFAVHDYFTQRGVTTFFPNITIEFRIAAADEHYHVPLLISPFGYSTYRGS